MEAFVRMDGQIAHVGGRRKSEMTEITTLNDFINWVESINPNLEPEKYLFRGLARSRSLCLATSAG